MTPYVVNQLVRWTDDGRVERVLWVDPALAGMYVIDVVSNTALPTFLNADFITRAESEKRLVIESKDTFLRVVAGANLTEKQRLRTEAAWSVVDPLIRAQPVSTCNSTCPRASAS